MLCFISCITKVQGPVDPHPSVPTSTGAVRNGPTAARLRTQGATPKSRATRPAKPMGPAKRRSSKDALKQPQVVRTQGPTSHQPSITAF